MDAPFLVIKLIRIQKQNDHVVWQASFPQVDYVYTSYEDALERARKLALMDPLDSDPYVVYRPGDCVTPEIVAKVLPSTAAVEDQKKALRGAMIFPYAPQTVESAKEYE